MLGEGGTCIFYYTVNLSTQTPNDHHKSKFSLPSENPSHFKTKVKHTLLKFLGTEAIEYTKWDLVSVTQVYKQNHVSYTYLIAAILNTPNAGTL